MDDTPLARGTIVEAHGAHSAIPRRAEIVDYRPVIQGDSTGYEYYVHYVEYNRRLDEWVPQQNVCLPSAEAANKPVVLSEEDALRSQISRFRVATEHSEHAAPEEHSDEEDRSAERRRLQQVKVRNIENLVYGPWKLRPWYYAPFPFASVGSGVEVGGDGVCFKESSRIINEAYVCAFCLSPFDDAVRYARHVRNRCLTPEARRPPGREMYRDGALRVFEVDGARDAAWCTRLCALGKLFLDSKTMGNVVDGFDFVVVTVAAEGSDSASHGKGLSRGGGIGPQPTSATLGTSRSAALRHAALAAATVGTTAAAPQKRPRDRGGSVATAAATYALPPIAAGYAGPPRAAARPDGWDTCVPLPTPSTTTKGVKGLPPPPPSSAGASPDVSPTTPGAAAGSWVFHPPPPSADDELTVGGFSADPGMDAVEVARVFGPLAPPPPAGWTVGPCAGPGAFTTAVSTLVTAPRPRLLPRHIPAPPIPAPPAGAPAGHYVAGFFSRPKGSDLSRNLACIVVFPPYQAYGVGFLLIDLSYALSLRAGVPGSPERPLSDLGLISYRSYWRRALMSHILGWIVENQAQIDGAATLAAAVGAPCSAEVYSQLDSEALATHSAVLAANGLSPELVLRIQAAAIAGRDSPDFPEGAGQLMELTESGLSPGCAQSPLVVVPLGNDAKKPVKRTDRRNRLTLKALSVWTGIAPADVVECLRELRVLLLAGAHYVLVLHPYAQTEFMRLILQPKRFVNPRFLHWSPMPREERQK